MGTSVYVLSYVIALKKSTFLIKDRFHVCLFLLLHLCEQSHEGDKLRMNRGAIICAARASDRPTV